jgi:hypothetical protein
LKGEALLFWASGIVLLGVAWAFSRLIDDPDQLFQAPPRHVTYLLNLWHSVSRIGVCNGASGILGAENILGH